MPKASELENARKVLIWSARSLPTWCSPLWWLDSAATPEPSKDRGSMIDPKVWERMVCMLINFRYSKAYLIKLAFSGVS